MLRAVTAEAARQHVRSGMSVSEAQSRCAALELLPWDGLIIGRELARATAAFLTASPLVSPVPDAPGTWWVGASGFDNMGGEAQLAHTLQQLAAVWHPRARVAIADSCVAARAATWASRQHIVPAGGCARYLAQAPLALIPMDDELRATLLTLGLHTAGMFAALEPGEVERRWGATGLASWRLANGDDARRPVLARTDAARILSTELAMSTATMEPVLFIVRAALGQLIDALVRDGRAAAAVAITLTLDDGSGSLSGAAPHTVTREVRPPSPIARVAPLFERCRALLDGWALTAPVSAVSVTVTATAPLGAEQGDLLAAAWRDPEAADAAFERLRSTLGALSVVRPVLRDEHRPDKAGAWSELHDTPARGSAKESLSPGLHPPTRLLCDPEAVDVDAPRGVPRMVWWRGQRIRVARAVGPERLSGDWWKDPFTRDYWRCESDELARDFLLYREAGGWRLQGWYD